MKFLSILLLAAVVLWNPTKVLADINYDTKFGPLDKVDKSLSSIVLKFQNPLRDVSLNLANYTLLLRTFDDFKHFDVEFISSLIKKVKNHDTLTGEELFVLRRTITIYYKFNKKILDFAKVYDFGGFKMSKTFAAEDRNLPLIKAHLIWLSGHLLVLEHLEIMHNLLYKNTAAFRRIVKNALIDKATGPEGQGKSLNDLIKMSKYTVEIGESQKFSQQIILVQSIEAELKAILLEEVAASTLLSSIVSNRTAHDIAQGKTKFEMQDYTFVDKFHNLLDQAVGALSGLFGNIAGAIKWRKGYLFHNQTANEIALSNLAPLDIILEKSPFVLTDKFIPGHYGHVAIYLGTQEQLEAINMWDHPDIVPYHEDISAGNVILEAVRSGVHLTTLEAFMDIDELTIVTKEGGLSEPLLLIEEITRGMYQIGKDYDFNFDVLTLDKIVCSELIYITYGNVLWPTQYHLGRPTITPDNIAEILFQKNTKFKIKNFMVAKEEHRIELVNLSYISDELDYELRSADGGPVKDQEDPTNSYWKRESKCYNIEKDSSDKSFPSSKETFQVCNTAYKEFYYEERTSL